MWLKHQRLSFQRRRILGIRIVYQMKQLIERLRLSVSCRLVGIVLGIGLGIDLDIDLDIGLDIGLGRHLDKILGMSLDRRNHQIRFGMWQLRQH